MVVIGKRRMIVVFLSALFLFAGTIAWAQAPAKAGNQKLSLGTGTLGGLYYIFGAGWACTSAPKSANMRICRMPVTPESDFIPVCPQPL